MSVFFTCSKAFVSDSEGSDKEEETSSKVCTRLKFKKLTRDQSFILLQKLRKQGTLKILTLIKFNPCFWLATNLLNSLVHQTSFCAGCYRLEIISARAEKGLN